jgi:hypothetical protein
MENIKLNIYNKLPEIKSQQIDIGNVDRVFYQKSERMSEFGKQAGKAVNIQSKEIYNARPDDALYAITQLSGIIQAAIIGADVMIAELLHNIEVDNAGIAESDIYDKPIDLVLPQPVKILGSLDEAIIEKTNQDKQNWESSGDDRQCDSEPRIYKPFSIGLGIPEKTMANYDNQIEAIQGKLLSTHNSSIAKLMINQISRQLGYDSPNIIEIPRILNLDIAQFIQKMKQELGQNTIFLKELTGGTEKFTKIIEDVLDYQTPCIDIVASGQSMKDQQLEVVANAPVQGLVLVSSKDLKIA